MSSALPTAKDIRDAHARIKAYVHKTPVLTSRSLDALFGGKLFFKCENFQKIGAFKFRGASNAVWSLTDAQAAKGVATHSSGNHAQGVALAAKMRGIPAYIVMPENSKQVKLDAVKGYGGQITLCQNTLESRETTCAQIVTETGAEFVHPYDDARVICGQGTAALELLEQVDALDIVTTPIGGGGLFSGTSIITKAVSPQTKLIGTEPEMADDAYRSFYAGHFIPVTPNTIADGLAATIGPLTFSIIKQNADEIVTVSEKGILAALRLVWERMKIVIEPSSAVPLAAILEKKIDVTNKRVGIILTGGNVELAF